MPVEAADAQDTSCRCCAGYLLSMLRWALARLQATLHGTSEAALDAAQRAVPARHTHTLSRLEATLRRCLPSDIDAHLLCVHLVLGIDVGSQGQSAVLAHRGDAAHAAHLQAPTTYRVQGSEGL